MGYDNIHPKIVKHAAYEIGLPLSHIINCSLSHGTFPDQLKMARVIPIYKKGSPCDVCNYRPISILPILSKIVESIINKQLLNYLEKNDILLHSQYGFRKKHSTKLALSDLVSYIAENLDKGCITFGIFIDLRKAFDTLNHSILIQKLNHYGIRGLPLQWFKSYLSSRQQTVSVGNYCSSRKNITCGVPQGSILGPILFLLYVNDIVHSTRFFAFRLFADDTNLFKCINDSTVNLNEIDNEFQKVCDWCNANKLTINSDKTHYMIIKSSRKTVNIEGNLHVDGTSIECVESTSYLGVNIDQHVNWRSHIDKITKSIALLVGIISRIRHFVPRSTLLVIYNSLILPRITYCIEIWGNTYNTFLQPILKLQKRLVRFITFSSFRCHTAPLFKELNILDIYKLRKLHTCLFAFDLKNNHYAHDINNYFDVLPHNYPTRFASNYNFYIPRVDLTINKHSFKYAATMHWNSLPLSLKKETRRTVFKEHLVNHLFST